MIAACVFLVSFMVVALIGQQFIFMKGMGAMREALKEFMATEKAIRSDEMTWWWTRGKELHNEALTLMNRVQAGVLNESNVRQAIERAVEAKLSPPKETPTMDTMFGKMPVGQKPKGPAMSGRNGSI